jgi:hypothetical protein
LHLYVATFGRLMPAVMGDGFSLDDQPPSDSSQRKIGMRAIAAKTVILDATKGPT